MYNNRNIKKEKKIFLFNKTISALIFLIWFSGNIVFSQSVTPLSNLKPAELKRYAKSAEEIGDYYTAITYYERYCELKADDYDIMFRLAEMYRAARDYEKAQKLYLKIYIGENLNTSLALFYLAQMQKMNGDYLSAKENFLKFKKKYDGKDAVIFKKLSTIEIDGCDVVKRLIDTIPLNIELTHLDTSINKPHIEFSPLFLNDTSFIYASLRNDYDKYYPLQDTVDMPVRKFYTAVKKSDEWDYSGEMEGPVNIDNEHVGNGSFSADGKRFYFTRCKKNWQNKMRCAIYMSVLEDDKWLEPQRLNETVNDPHFTSTQPTIGFESAKGREVLYFISDKDGGKGGLDIWYSIYDSKNGMFSESKNAGGKINSVGDEFSPFYDRSTNTLYFSSTGWPGIGGLDVFRTDGELTKWSTPENVGYPVNSFADDTYYNINQNHKEGFVVSNRRGGVVLKNPTCCDDIYYFKFNKFFVVVLKDGVFEMDDSTKIIKQDSPVPGVVVTLNITDETGNEMIFLNSDTTGLTGNFEFTLRTGKKYTLIASKDGYFNNSVEINTKGELEKDTLYNTIGLLKIPEKPLVIENMLYEYDEHRLTEDSKAYLDNFLLKMLVDNPDIIIEIRSHTDNKGSEEYNEKLSQKRAESVTNYLIEKGIEKSRLVAKGYGESVPIAPNEDIDGTDNPEGRQKNRRTEFNVIRKSNLVKKEDS